MHLIVAIKETSLARRRHLYRLNIARTRQNHHEVRVRAVDCAARAAHEKTAADSGRFLTGVNKSAVENVHRYFKTKTHFDELRFAPGHIRLLMVNGVSRKTLL
jgi:hypothetical protein